MVKLKHQLDMNMKILPAIVAFLTIHSCPLSLSQTYCDDKQECIYQTIDDTQIECRGMQSCYGGTLTTNISNIFCNGYYSCNEATINSSSTVICDAKWSCLSSKIVARDSIACSADRACETMFVVNASRLECLGNTACTDMFIVSVPVIYGFGWYAMHTSDIYSRNPYTESSSNTYKMQIYLYGYYAGWNLNIYCRTDDFCYIYCKSNGCEGTRLVCDDGSTCITTCDDDATGDICAHTTTTTTDTPTEVPTYPDIINATLATTNILIHPNGTSNCHDNNTNKNKKKNDDNEQEIVAIIILSVLLGIAIIVIIGLISVMVGMRSKLNSGDRHKNQGTSGEQQAIVKVAS